MQEVAVVQFRTLGVLLAILGLDPTIFLQEYSMDIQVVASILQNHCNIH